MPSKPPRAVALRQALDDETEDFAVRLRSEQLVSGHPAESFEVLEPRRDRLRSLQACLHRHILERFLGAEDWQRAIQSFCV